MNIFLLSYERNPAKHFAEQARFHCDKHVVKMIAESVQLIVTSLSSSPLADRYSGSMPSMAPSALPCKPLSKGHAKHPCSIWASADISHAYYLVRLGLALCAAKNSRWPLNPSHEYESWLRSLNHDFEVIGFQLHDPIPTHFPVAINTASEQSTSQDHHIACSLYRSYYVQAKARFATWRNTSRPLWFIMGLEAASQSATLTTQE